MASISEVHKIEAKLHALNILFFFDMGFLLDFGHCEVFCNSMLLAVEQVKTKLPMSTKTGSKLLKKYGSRFVSSK